MAGVQELTVEDPVLWLLAGHLLDAVRALAERGHAATARLALSAQVGDPAGELRPVVRALEPARGHPEWERAAGRRARRNAERAELEADLARLLDRGLDRVAGRTWPRPKSCKESGLR